MTHSERGGPESGMAETIACDLAGPYPADRAGYKCSEALLYTFFNRLFFLVASQLIRQTGQSAMAAFQRLYTKRLAV